MSTSGAKEEIRAAFPQCTAVADQFRDVFGAGVRLAYAEEGGRTIGRKTDESRYRAVSLGQMLLNPTKARHGR